MSMFWLILAGCLIYTGALMQQLFPAVAVPVLWAVAVAVFWLMLSWQFLYRNHAAVIEAPWFSLLAWSGGILFGVWATFVLLSLPLNLAGLGWQLLQGAPPGWLRPALQAALLLAVILAAIGMVQTLWGPIVRRVDILANGLHADLQGLTIAQISDLHIGPTIRRPYVKRMVRDVLALQPDLIVVTGDLADGHVAHLREHVAPLAELRAPLGIFFVTGNHEYYWGVEQWLAAVREFGATPLLDCGVALRRGAAQLFVGGVTDAAAARFVAAHCSDVRAAAEGSQAADYRLLLAHRPGACTAAEAAGFDLQLSGHTHGGQFFPFNLVVRLAHRYHRGLVRHGRMWLYVSAGTGYWGPPHRFWIPAEITLLRLARA
jgi:predicted MPP superfamily phosphohydrolase